MVQVRMSQKTTEQCTILIKATKNRQRVMLQKVFMRLKLNLEEWEEREQIFYSVILYKRTESIITVCRAQNIVPCLHTVNRL